MSVRSDEATGQTTGSIEEASTAKSERSRCLEELKNQQSELQQLIKDFEAKPEEVKARKDKYENVFHKFVNSHENYMKYVRDEERKELMIDNYNSLRDMKLQLDCMVDVWRNNRERYKSPPSESGSSIVSRRSQSSRSSSRSSVTEKRRVLEETRLNMQTLKEKQELERQLDLVQQKKTELYRKIDLLSAESEFKQAKIDLVIEQTQDDRNSIRSKHPNEFQTDVEKDHPTLNTDPLHCNPTTFFVPSQEVTSPQYVTTSLSNPHRSDLDDAIPIRRTEMSALHLSGTKQGRSVRLNTASQPFIPRDEIQTTANVATQPMQNTDEQETRSQIDAWSSIAQIIKEGPSLPKVELMKFSGDPLEYVEFMTNFKDNIESQVKDESRRFTRLLAQCNGKARDAIRSCVNLDANQRYREAMKVLLENFGQSHMIVEAHMKKLKELQIKRSDAVALMEFVRHLEDSERALKRMGTGYSKRLDNEDVIVMLMKKLPEDSLKRKWADKAGGIIKTKGVVTFNDFVSFLKHIAGRINNRYGRELRVINESKKLPANKSRFDQPRGICTSATQNRFHNEQKTPKLRKCPVCSDSHGIWRCQVFKSAGLEDRLKTVKQHKLCNICLDEGHIAKACKSGFTCRIGGCGMDHHYLIHREQSPRKDDDQTSKDNTKRPKGQILKENNEVRSTTGEQQKPPSANLTAPVLESPSSNPVNVHAVKVSRPRVCFKVVPVRVSVPNSQKELITYAFLDSGSDATLCLESLVQELQIEDIDPVKYTMTTVNCEQEKLGYEVRLSIQSISGGEKFDLDNVLTTDSLPVTPRHVAQNEELREWRHLQDLVLPETEDKTITILIGSDRPDIIDTSLDRREGRKGEPCAVKTPLGWTVYGPMGDADEGEISVSFIRSEYEVLDRKLERMFNAEFDDINEDVEDTMSIEDRAAMQMMIETTTLKDGHYQIGLPFKHNPPRLPDSLPTAKRRLEYLNTKMERDPVFHEKYSRVMKKYEEEGAAQEVPVDDLATFKPQWYLPHHAVWHPRKPEEPRVVFDCAAKTEGVSLNDELLRGPKNTSTLLGVILRFRVDNIAVTADVKRMFHQVYVIPEHRSALCYLWWPDGDLKKAAKTYQMLVHIFGAKSSPSVAGYALRRSAKDRCLEYSEEILDAVCQDFYVDDLLKSFPDAAEAKQVSKELQSVLAKGGFELTKWCSNSREVLEQFPVEGRAPTVKDLDLQSEELPIDRALGIRWDVERDMIMLIVDGRKEQKNRRGVLSSIATVYDPLGFASPLILPAREINQELCRLKLDWNSELPTELCTRWEKWKSDLANLHRYEIPRCFKPKQFVRIEEVELHHFADASQEHGYGTVSYLRFTNEKGNST